MLQLLSAISDEGPAAQLSLPQGGDWPGLGQVLWLWYGALDGLLACLHIPSKHP